MFALAKSNFEKNEQTIINVINSAFEQLAPECKVTAILPRYKKWKIDILKQTVRVAEYEKSSTKETETGSSRALQTITLTPELAEISIIYNGSHLNMADEEKISSFVEHIYFIDWPIDKKPVKLIAIPESDSLREKNENRQIKIILIISLIIILALVATFVWRRTTKRQDVHTGAP